MTEPNQNPDVDDAVVEGRAAVRRYLVAPLEAAGMVRPKKRSEAEHRDWLVKLCDRLAYMTAGNLQVLAGELVMCGQGAQRNEWPGEVIILGWAEALQRRPWQDRPIVSSWLRSVEGPVALAGGYAVELMGWLRRHGRPPLVHDMRQIREQAAEHQRRVLLTQDRIDRHAARPEDMQWLESYLRDLAFARGLIEAGADHRAAKEAAE